MDPSATLFTFMLETHPSVQTVTLVGSWDNFSQHYAMERDLRRDKGQWRGCHALQCRPNEPGFAASKRSGGGLRMGQTYHYYYELNGTTEAHDPRQPSTTSCPRLPGQLVNTLEVPVEHSLRLRSCSMNNLRSSDFRTVNPKDKYKSPMPPQPLGVAPGPADVRVGTAPAIQLIRKRSARSLSPNPKWTASARRIFGTIRPSSREGNGSARTLADWDADITTLEASAGVDRARSTTPSGSARSRDISPNSLRRFLLGEEAPTAAAAPAATHQPAVWTHDDMAEDNDDDDNFATLTTSPTLDNMPFTTLSPPPFMRSASAQPSPSSRSGAMGLSAPPPRSRPQVMQPPQKEAQPANIRLRIPKSRFISKLDSPGTLSPVSNTSGDSHGSHGDKSHVSFLEDSEDEVSNSRTGPRRGSSALKAKATLAFTGYRLPQPVVAEKPSKDVAHMSVAFGSPEFVAQATDDSVLSLPQLEAGLSVLGDDFSWITGLDTSKNL
ncbi:hypothetical protein Micbo1qcDRAFT_202538 [Microdochium bolleyi]|uniref:AMP-activated protein kinase glycogen-binding domain-containing protein n=1 Tax=Microdochium bolleyi TaxID=196109 RepID=A0A136JC22_9PEZI|nr:hypothetical protein Micbo1qcDRAFT_202538 [Microdochium bolleyi]